MASTSYTKKTWKGRLGTDLDKYTIGPVDLNGHQKITPYTGGVTQQGDPLSAGNLNDLEGRIDSAFESVEEAISSEATARENADDTLDAEITKIKNGTTTVEKAKKDEDGDNIKATYATKTELSNEITTRQTAVSDEQNARQTADTNEQNARIAKDVDLQSQIDRHTAQIKNLNSKAGDYIVDTYRDGDATPSGKEPYAMEEMLRGVSRLANQLIPISSVESQTINGITWTNNRDGSYTANGTATENSTIILQRFIFSDVIKKDHVYLLNTGYIDPTANSFRTEIISRDSDNQNVLFVDAFSPTIVSVTGTGKNLFVELRVVNGNTANNFVFRPTLTDLTTYFGSDPSVDVSTLTIADIQQRYPQLLIPRAYNTDSLVDTTYSAVKSGYKYNSAYKWRNGYYNSAGQYALNINAICTVEGGFPITNGQNIVATSDTTCEIDFNIYDANGTQLTYKQTANVSTANITAVANSAFVNVSFRGSGITASNIKITIGGNDSVVIDSLHLPTTVTLRSAGSVQDTDELCVEVDVEVDGVQKRVNRRRQTKRIGQVDAGILNWSYNGSYGFYVLLSNIPNIKVGSYSASSELLCPTYTKSTQEQITAVGGTDMAMAIGIQFLYASNSKYSDATSFKASLSGVMLYYELANPVVTLLDPIYDNALLTEAYGTISTVQTQSPKVDGSFDMGFMTA